MLQVIISATASGAIQEMLAGRDARCEGAETVPKPLYGTLSPDANDCRVQEAPLVERGAGASTWRVDNGRAGNRHRDKIAAREQRLLGVVLLRGRAPRLWEVSGAGGEQAELWRPRGLGERVMPRGGHLWTPGSLEGVEGAAVAGERT